MSSLQHCDGCSSSPLDHLHSHGTCASKARSKVCRSSPSVGAETAGRSTRAHGEATAAPMAAPTHGYRLNQQSAGKSIPLTPKLMGPGTGKVCQSATDLFSATTPLHFHRAIHTSLLSCAASGITISTVQGSNTSQESKRGPNCTSKVQTTCSVRAVLPKLGINH